MSRRGENIYKRKDGRWEGRYIKGRNTNGKIKYGYVYSKTYGETKRKLYSCKMKYQNITENVGNTFITMCELSQQWLEFKYSHIKISTYASYQYKLNHYILSELGEKSINELDEDNLKKMIHHWQEQGLSPNTIKITFRILNQCIAYAVRLGYLKKNICELIILPKKINAKIPALSLPEQKRLEKIALESSSMYGAAVLLSLRTGLRIGEICALKWKHINFKTNILHIEQTVQRINLDTNNSKTQLCISSAKTDSSNRIIPISKQVRTLLLMLMKINKSAYVFTNGSNFCEPRLMTYHFHKIRAKAGLENIHFHQLRHTFATRCIESKADIVSVSALLGHSSTKMTLDIYADSILEQRQKTIYLMEKEIA